MSEEQTMSGFVNKAILVGNLGRDPEIRHKQDGSKVATFNIATSESWNDKQSGERVVIAGDKIPQ